MKDAEWNEAMSWWKGQTTGIQCVIRNVACDKMVARGAEEIGTSDINHAVYSMHKEYVAAGSPDVMSFLMDQL